MKKLTLMAVFYTI